MSRQELGRGHSAPPVAGYLARLDLRDLENSHKGPFANRKFSLEDQFPAPPATPRYLLSQAGPQAARLGHRHSANQLPKGLDPAVLVGVPEALAPRPGGDLN